MAGMVGMLSGRVRIICTQYRCDRLNFIAVICSMLFPLEGTVRSRGPFYIL